MQQEASGGSGEEAVGGGSGRDEQRTPDEKTAAQTRTFTRWMNVFLQRSDPPAAVRDLLADIQDGRVLMALLEQLSGCKLLYRFRSSPQRIFRLNNISTVLAFLHDRHVNLLGIDASGVADGVPSVVLNLVWNIILHFQVKEAMGGLHEHLSCSLSSSSLSSSPRSSHLAPQTNGSGSNTRSTLPSRGRKAAKYHRKTTKALLLWVQRRTSRFGVEVHDFGRSWRSGLAFLAMIKSIKPSLVDLRESLSREPRENVQLAFMVARHSLDIPPLLEPDDVSCTSPDEWSIITYVSMFPGHCSGIDEDLTHINVPEIPSFRSVEAVSFGETLTDEPEAQALLKALQKSSEQLLWKKWARRSSESPAASWPHSGGASDPSCRSVDTFSTCRSRSIVGQPVDHQKMSRSISNPPSPLDAGVASQEIRSWMKKASMEHRYDKPRADGSHFSLSSEEGIYSLSALDSDEEEARSHRLDLNKEVFLPCARPGRRVPKAEETFLNGEQIGTNAESEAVAQPVVDRNCDGNEKESSFRETANNTDVFEPEEERVVRGPSTDDCCEEEKEKKTERAGALSRGSDKTEAPVDEAKKRKPSEADRLKTELEEETAKRLLENCGQVIRETAADSEEEDNLKTFEGGRDKKVKEEERGNQKNGGKAAFEARGTRATADKGQRDGDVSAPRMEDSICRDKNMGESSYEVKNLMDFETIKGAEKNDRECKIEGLATNDSPGRTTSEDPYKGVTNHSGDTGGIPPSDATAQPFREGGFILETLAAACNITLLELEVLLVLWILIYCYFILGQMNL